MLRELGILSSPFLWAAGEAVLESSTCSQERDSKTAHCLLAYGHNSRMRLYDLTSGGCLRQSAWKDPRVCSFIPGYFL